MDRKIYPLRGKLKKKEIILWSCLMVLDKKNNLDRKNLSVKKILFQKYWIQIIFGSKKIWRGGGPNCTKEFGSKQIWIQKKNLVQKNFGSKKILGPKKFWVQKYYGSKKLVGPKKFGVQKNCGSKKIWVCKIFWVKNFWSPLPTA